MSMVNARRSMAVRIVHFARGGLATAVLLALSSCTEHVLLARKKLAIRYATELYQDAPCLASLVGPASLKAQCVLWNANVDSGVGYDASRRLLFVGSADHFLHVIDADSGKSFAQIASTGRVVTDTVFTAQGSKFIFGTDQGQLSVYDAYTFKQLIKFTADSKISNDFYLIDEKIVFTSGLGTVYCVDITNGEEIWQRKRPLDRVRLRLASNSNILALDATNEGESKRLLVPHADGYVSVIDAETGAEKKIYLANRRDAHFPDIIAPMFRVASKIFVASYDAGLFVIDTLTLQSRSLLPFRGIQEMTFFDDKIFLASLDSLQALKVTGEKIWENKFGSLKTRFARYAYPFDNLKWGSLRVFFGLPSRLLILGDSLILASSGGALGRFNIKDGSLRNVVGNMVGFGPKLALMDSHDIISVTRSGLLFRISEF
jgi:outer membrane protein assembly factor BamB